VHGLLAGRSVDSAELRSYLSECSQWRDRLQTWLHSGDFAPASKVLTSRRAALYLYHFLKPAWTEPELEAGLRSPYSVAPFPIDALEGPLDPRESVLEILRWRAGFVDWISDIWDVAGEPELDLFECRAIERFLTPADVQNPCIFCLKPLAEDESRHYGSECPLLLHVRAKWPSKLPRWISPDDLYGAPGPPHGDDAPPR
jgi:hypothetical protein